ncbi:hypothetical protein DL239_03610 [Sedimentitalea sp. CY04]|uniref:Histidine phosphatase family protein n=1 Tax=Parasedimentitalea denitrificans TaxID=2211118 RepID=A0ABX0W6Y7_9RHOB|nr:phosphoglycerate mutase family protein [Sedimentitalea sp. CY04]NIZ60060.1 hypothetical protein [Sedimentitalea sp. CY04]
MPTLEVRRHTMRTKPGQHLSQTGVSLARHVGQDLSSFDLVVSSELPRAIETAIAMGFAADRMIAELGILPKEVLTAINWPNSLTNISQIVHENEACRQFSQNQAALWNAILGEMSGDQFALIITHGGIIELGALGLMPVGDPDSWGDAIGYCEGFRFTNQGNELICEVLRLPDQLRIINN